MINATFKLDWQGGDYTTRLHSKLKAAVKKSAVLVRRTASDLLSKSGTANKAIQALNNTGKLKGADAVAERFRRGEAAMRSLKGFDAGASKIRHGGKFNFYKANTETIRWQLNGRKAVTKVKKDPTKYSASRVYWNNATHRWTEASAPGTPPHRQTGKLSEIVYEFSQSSLHAKIGPRQGLKYARAQELGYKRLPARPYLKPAFDTCANAIMMNFYTAMVEAAK
jgi:hypothetical protein